MKKLLLLPTLLLAINLGATTTEATEVTQTTKEKAIAFLARHADKLKKFSYATDIACATIAPCTIIAETIYQITKNKNVEKIAENIRESLSLILISIVICKCFTDPATKYAMNKKHAFDLEALKKELTDQQKKTATA